MSLSVRFFFVNFFFDSSIFVCGHVLKNASILFCSSLSEHDVEFMYSILICLLTEMVSRIYIVNQH